MNSPIQQFIEKATLAGSVVSRVKSLREALDYTTTLCSEKEKCQILYNNTGYDSTSSPKTIIAPALAQEDFEELKLLAESKGVVAIQNGMRDYLGGLDIGLTFCQYGIAETGSLVLNSSNEEVRLATMISEIHVAILPVSKIVPSAEDIADELSQFMRQTPNYLAFITGPSRTADIERVLALGVHGPLHLHLLLLEND